MTIPLETITAQKDGTGSTTTTTIEDISVAQLFGEEKERFILLHAEAKKGEGVPPGIACADLAPLADTGGLRPATLLLTGAISALGVAVGLSILQQRIGAESTDHYYGLERLWVFIWDRNKYMTDNHGRTFDDPGRIYSGWILEIPSQKYRQTPDSREVDGGQR